MEKYRLSFWSKFLAPLRIDLKMKFYEGPKNFKYTQEIVYSNVMNELALNLDSLLLPVIIAYISEVKAKNTSTSNVYKELFNCSVDTTLKKLEEFHSPTLEHIYNRCRRFKNHLMTAMSRIYSDWDEISEKFEIVDDVLRTANFTCGDEHADGAQTSIFLFGEENRGFVYKPIDVKIDRMLNNIIASCEQDSGGCDLKTLKIIPKKLDALNHYGYIEYCKYKGNVKTKTEAAQIYKNFGKLIAYGKAFRITDGHCDNVIINSPSVCWLDLETAFHTFSGDMEDVHPIEKTGLLFEAKQNNVYIGIVTGIQGGVIPRLGLTRPYPYNDGTDDLYLRFFKLIDAQSYTNRVYLNNVMLLPEKYAKDIKDGYRSTYTYICKNKERIINQIKNYLKEEVVYTRHLFMVTACYARYIGLIQHILGNKNANMLANIRLEREALLSEKEKPFKEFIIENEMMDLCNGVIPYFLRASNSDCIFHASRSNRKGFFNSSLPTDIEAHILGLSIDDIDNDIKFIDRALKSTANINSWEEFVARYDFQMFQYEERLKQ